MTEILAEVRGRIGCLTLHRPRALNALSLDMIRALDAQLGAWASDDQVLAVALRGMGKESPFGVFCAGGDIRFFHQAAWAADPRLGDFFTEEYRLNHRLHTYAKPVLAFMDGIVMGGGMGLAQGSSWRLASERTRMAMPETLIGLFPDVAGGYFLSRCPGRLGEYLGMTGQSLDGAQALSCGLADQVLPSPLWPDLWQELMTRQWPTHEALLDWLKGQSSSQPPIAMPERALIDDVFALPSVLAMVLALEARSDAFSQATAAALRQRSPLMLEVTLQQIRRARNMSLADELRMERDLVHHAFHARPVADSDTVEGIRALVVDKDQCPRWKPERLESVDPAEVARWFESPWTPAGHPLRDLR